MNTSAMKQNKRLSNVIKMLQNQLGTGDNALGTNISPDSEKISNNSNEEMQALNGKDVTEQLDLPRNEMSIDWRSQEDGSLTKSHLMFENNSNLCWLDSSMSLLMHNKTLSYFVNDSSQIANIRKGYESAISVLNDYSNESTIEERLRKAKNILQKVQETVLDYLKPILKCKEGEPDSAFCSLLNLIGENSRIKNLFLVEFSWIRNCTKCVIPRVRNNEKTIITLSKVLSFNPSSPVSLYKCRFCESADQEIVIKYKTLPQCLIFHFENGAGEGELDSLDFELNDRKYKLSGLIKLERSRDLTVSHFVTWVRDIVTDSWLECNDLNCDISSFSVVPPLVNLKDLYIVMYEAQDDKGTISNVSEDIDDTFKIDTDDTSSSDIPIIDLFDEEEGTEIKQEDQIDKGTSNTVFLGSLFKSDKTDYDSVEKMPKQLDNILSDNVFSAKSTLESSENNAVSKKEKISAENSELQNLDLQYNASSTSSVKTDDAPLQMNVFSKSFGSNSQSDSKNGPKNSVAVNIKQSLVKDSIKICIRDENKRFTSSNSEMASFTKPVLDNTVKTSKEINGKPLIGTSSIIEKMGILIDKKDTISGNRNIPLRLAENLPGKDLAVVSNSSSRKNTSNAFEIQDNNNNSNFPRKSAIEPQNKLDISVLAETNNFNLSRSNSSSKNPPTPFENQDDDKNAGCSRKSPVEPENSKLARNISVQTNYLNLNSPINAAGDCTEDAVESCAGTSDLPSSRKELKKKFKTDNHDFKKCKTIENEKFTEDAAVDYIDNLLTVHDDEKTVEESHILGRKASENSSSEISKETESTASKQNHISANLKTTLNPPDEKSTLNLFENKAHINISRNVVAKHADNSDKEVFVDVNNLTIDSTIKQSKVNAKSLESAASKVSENKNSTSSRHQTTILNNTAGKQPEDTLASSVKPNEQLTVQSVESREITESVSLKKTAKQHIREFEEKHTIFSQNQVEVKNLPSKKLFVKLTRLKNCEIANYVSGNFNFEETKQIKSLEELTKTVVVKVEKTDSKSILKRTAKQAAPSKATKVESIEPVRKSSRIFARKMKKAKESLLEPVSMERKNSQEQLVNSISTIKRRRQTAPTEVTEKTLKTEDLPKRSYRTRSTTDFHSGVSSGAHSRKNAKKRDSNADEGVKSKRRRTNSIKAQINSGILLPTLLSLEGTSSSQLIHDEPDVLLRVLGPSTNENSLISTNKNNPVTDHEIAMYSGNRIQPYSGVSQSNSVHEHEARNVKEDTGDKTEECISLIHECDYDDFQMHEVVEISANTVYMSMFKFFNLGEKQHSY